jgi:multidrug efflux system membrane fusion protein
MTARSRPEIEISSIPGRSFKAQVSELATAADPATRTFAATFVFDNPGDVSIRSGMTAKLTITVPDDVVGATGPSIPSGAAIADETGSFYVWVVDPQTMTVARRSVELGELTGESVRVRSGLAGTEWIAVSGVHHLREGMVVSRLAS